MKTKPKYNCLVVCGECYKIYICHKITKKTVYDSEYTCFSTVSANSQIQQWKISACFQSGPRWLCVWYIKGHLRFINKLYVIEPLKPYVHKTLQALK